MKKNFLFIVLFIAGMTCARAQEEYKIYDGVAPGSEGASYEELEIPSPWRGNPLILNVTEPTITVYKPEAEVNTGAAMIIAPGGGNMYLTWKEEGINVAQWFQRHGVTGIVLKYRTSFMGNNEEEVHDNMQKFFSGMSDFSKEGEKAAKEKRITQTRPSSVPFEKTIQGDDGRQAIAYVRTHATEFGIDPDRIGIMGFSAGGALTCNVMAFNDELSKPNLTAPIYGARAMALPENPVPTFICAPEFDLGSPDGAIELYKVYQQAKIPAELHFITDASHGNGLLYNGQEWNEFIELLYNFMKAVKFTEKK